MHIKPTHWGQAIMLAVLIAALIFTIVWVNSAAADSCSIYEVHSPLLGGYLYFHICPDNSEADTMIFNDEKYPLTRVYDEQGFILDILFWGSEHILAVALGDTANVGLYSRLEWGEAEKIIE